MADAKIEEAVDSTLEACSGAASPSTNGFCSSAAMVLGT